MSTRSITSSKNESDTEPEQEGQWVNTSTTPYDEESAQPHHGEQGKKDPNEVGWEGDNDQENPRNWSTGYKTWITFQLGMLALAASMGSSIIAPAEDDIAQYVGVSREVTVLSISLYM